MRTLFKSCNLSEQTHDHLNVFAADPRPWRSTSLAHVSQKRRWQTTAQTHLAFTLLLHICFVTLSILLRSRVLQSRVFSVPLASSTIYAHQR